jgi:site-specific recombinase XerD
MHVVAVARHLGFDPATLEERQVGDFLLFLRNERHYAPSSMAQSIVALRTFYRDHLGRKWDLWKTIKVRRPESLPVVLTREEVAAIFRATRCLRFRVIFRLVLPRKSGHVGRRFFC